MFNNSLLLCVKLMNYIYHIGVTMSLEGKGRYLEIAQGRFMCYIPTVVARDSQFPFKPKDPLLIKVEEDKLVITLDKERMKEEE